MATPAVVASHPASLTDVTVPSNPLTRKDGKMANQSKSNKGSKQSNRGEQNNRGEQQSRGQQSNQGQQSSPPGKQASGSVQSSRDNPSRKGAAGEREEGSNVSFACADLGHPECSWQASGRNEEELLPKIEQHGREKHGIKTFDNQTREKIRGAIRPQAA